MTEPNHEHSPPVPTAPIDPHAECKIGLPANHTHEHVGWARYRALVGFLILLVGVTVSSFITWQVVQNNRVLIGQNRALIENVAKDCVDVDGDLSYRHVMRGLIRMNNNKNPFTNKPLPADITLDQRRALTAELLQRGLDEAGSVPSCIEAQVP